MVSISTVATRELSLQPWQWFIISMLFITICVDTAIAVSMSHYLKTSDPGFRRTSRVVDQMVLYTMGIVTNEGHLNSKTIIRTESPASVSALASGISFLITPEIFIWLGLFIIESGLYTNSLLAALNARAKFSRELQHPESAGCLEMSLSILDT
ncbi:hypothetical protein EDD16DRAFT_1071788 [Pisolithus croceorrhizus]|nr:hypothetical protein EDD16DRAFT_1071788 [Pisolithus croceorrhizus]